VLTRANHAPVEELPSRPRGRPRTYAPRAIATVPDLVPDGVLNPLSIRAFNEMWFRKAPRARHGQIQTISAFFHPLDGVLDWNRVYGTRGFLQYQYVVPYGAEAVVRTTLQRLSASRCASFLAVLKRFEHTSDGHLGFPMHGWTLALDIPARGGTLGDLLDDLDRLVADAGGRVYLTKDARLTPELLPAMYPRLDEWREVRARLDPAHVLRSDMDRRLGLAGDTPGPAA
jgi:decaprenylphospho-beta-D-ribofuranose 2-oxidase